MIAVGKPAHCRAVERRKRSGWCLGARSLVGFRGSVAEVLVVDEAAFGLEGDGLGEVAAERRPLVEGEPPRVACSAD